MFGVAIASDRTSGRTAGRTSPRISVAGIEGAIRDSALSGESCAESRPWLGTGAVRLSVTGITEEEADDDS